MRNPASHWVYPMGSWMTVSGLISMWTGTFKVRHTPPIIQPALTLFKRASLFGKASYKPVRAEYQPFAVISNHQLSTNGTQKNDTNAELCEKVLHAVWRQHNYERLKFICSWIHLAIHWNLFIHHWFICRKYKPNFYFLSTPLL